jgi:hypothetical protein
MLGNYNTNDEYQKLLAHIGGNLAESWSFEDLQTIYDTRVIDMMRHNKIHKHLLYNDVAWYIVEHSDRKIEDQKHIKNMYFLIEVNGSIYEDGLEDDLEDILSTQVKQNHKRITKKYWEAINLIKADLEVNPLED